MFRSWCRCASACTLVLALVFLHSSRLEAQTLRILFTSVNGSTVTIQGEDFASVTNITLGTVALENIVVSPAGDMITATLPVAMPNGSHLLTLTSSQSTSPVTCATASPAPDWVCVGDRSVPAGHPLAAAATPTTTTTTTAFVATIGNIGPQGPQGLQEPSGRAGRQRCHDRADAGAIPGDADGEGCRADLCGDQPDDLDCNLHRRQVERSRYAAGGGRSEPGLPGHYGKRVTVRRPEPAWPAIPHLTWNGTTWTLGTGTTRSHAEYQLQPLNQWRSRHAIPFAPGLDSPLSPFASFSRDR